MVAFLIVSAAPDFSRQAFTSPHRGGRKKTHLKFKKKLTQQQNKQSLVFPYDAALKSL